MKQLLGLKPGVLLKVKKCESEIIRHLFAEPFTPVIVMEKVKYVKEGESLMIQCNVSASPAPTIILKKGGGINQ